MCKNNHHQLGWGISELTVLEKRTPESWEKSYGAWFHMNCLRRAVTSITFPWERSCLAWKKFTGSRIRTVVYMLLIRSQSLCTISENLYIQPNQNTWRQCVFLQTHGYVETSFMMQLCFFMSNFLFNVITMLWLCSGWILATRTTWLMLWKVLWTTCCCHQKTAGKCPAISLGVSRALATKSGG